MFFATRKALPKDGPTRLWTRDVLPVTAWRNQARKVDQCKLAHLQRLIPRHLEQLPNAREYRTPLNMRMGKLQRKQFKTLTSNDFKRRAHDHALQLKKTPPVQVKKKAKRRQR